MQKSKGKEEKKVPAKGRALTRQKKKPLLLEVGKTYLTRDGIALVEIIGRSDDLTYPFSGVVISDDGFHGLAPGDSFTASGDYCLSFGTDAWDLVAEVPARKASRKGAK